MFLYGFYYLTRAHFVYVWSHCSFVVLSPLPYIQSSVELSQCVLSNLFPPELISRAARYTVEGGGGGGGGTQWEERSVQ